MSVSSVLWTPEDRWHALSARVFDACAREAGADWPGREISLLLCDDEEIRSINREWRGFDKPTNVLSFPAADAPGAPLGDIAIAFETSHREAQDEGKTVDDHVAHLLVHGVLHLLGHDHETNGEAEIMEATERHVLARLGIADPYAASEPFAMSDPMPVSS